MPATIKNNIDLCLIETRRRVTREEEAVVVERRVPEESVLRDPKNKGFSSNKVRERSPFGDIWKSPDMASIYIREQLGGTVLGQKQARLAPAGRQHPLVMIS